MIDELTLTLPRPVWRALRQAARAEARRLRRSTYRPIAGAANADHVTANLLEEARAAIERVLAGP